MTHRVLNLVQQIATGTGIGPLPLAGATSPQFRTMQAAGIEDGDTTYLRIQNPTNPNTEWEVALCTYNDGVITRAFDEHSFSATGSLINFTAGNKVVSGVIVAGDLMLLSDYADVLGDVVAAADSAYEAQGASIAAAEDALSARLSQAQYFPPDFVEESKFWTGGQGQASSPTVAANNPLPGTFIAVEDEGQVYRTEADPQTCNSFGPVGLIAGVPGSTIQLSARIRAITDNTGGTPVEVGVSLLHLSAEFNYTMFTPGAGLPTCTVADGWQQVDFSFVIPALGHPDFSPYYRPSLFYNVVGASTDPLQGSDDPQGDQVFQVAYFRVITGFYATLDSPNFIGNPTAPTPDPADDDTSIPTTEWVNDRIASLAATALPPTGPAGGDLGGTYPNPTVDSTLFILPALPVIRDITSGATNYVPTAGAKLARVHIKGGGGGGAGGGGAGAADGVNGGNTTFGGWTAGGGLKGSFYNAGVAPGGAGGTNTTPGGAPSNWKRDGAYGGSGPGGYTFGFGGHGGGGPSGQQGATSPQGKFASGCGGPGGGSGSTAGPGGGGGEGGEIIFWLAGATLTTTAYSVGAGGTGGVAGATGAAGTAGFGGFIFIEEFF